jgi:hypothetical protein
LKLPSNNHSIIAGGLGRTIQRKLLNNICDSFCLRSKLWINQDELDQRLQLLHFFVSQTTWRMDSYFFDDYSRKKSVFRKRLFWYFSSHIYSQQTQENYD